jgi:ribonucleoside-diphosphate reductase alpha chain
MVSEDNKTILVVKRDGSTEPYDENKLKKVILWACDGDPDIAQILLESFDIKINNMTPIEKLYQELIFTAANLMSPLQPMWDNIAEKLLLMKYYKDRFNLKNTGYYPQYTTLVKKAIEDKLYSKEVFESFTQEELNELGQYIVPDRDLNYTYKGLYITFNKYCFKNELLQHAYMRMAIFSHYNDDPEVRMENIKLEYDAWSGFIATAGTPRILNSGGLRPQLASCVLSTTGDDTHNIMDTARNLATYSKYSGGLANDISAIRTSNSKITGNKGTSNGPVPFVKIFEQTVSSFNQGGLRVGACVITYPDWNMDVHALVVLNDAGGTEEARARRLKYTIRLSRVFLERVKNNENYSLFNPQDVPRLLDTYGEEFEKHYKSYESDNTINKKSVNARELMFAIIKARKETGNLYIFFADNVNEQSIVGDYIGASNLCTEITVTSTPSKNYKEKVVTEEDGTVKIISEKEAGEIGLCNLFSINLYEWHKLTREQKEKYMYVLLRGADNVIETQFYPIKEAKISNIRKRPIGIGVSNYANLLASQKLHYTDPEALKFVHELFEELYFIIYKLSNRLAQERGPFEYFKHTNWAKGLTPLHLSKLHKKGADHRLNFEYKEDWDGLAKDIKTYGVRFSLHGAIAPTATSGRAISATESTDPIIELMMMEDGTQTLPALVPNIKQNREYYDNAYGIPIRTLFDHAAVRQKFIDQSQSVNEYRMKPESAKEIAQDLIYAEEVGMKTLYYFKTPKSGFTLECESCT